MKSHRLRIASALLAAALCGLVSPAAAVNMLANPGFETGGASYTGWFTFGSGVQLSTPATDNIIRTGGAASKVYGGFSGCPNSPVFNVGGFGQAFTPVAGNVYELSGWSFISSADSIPGTNTCAKNRMLAKIAYFNAASGGVELASNEIVIGDGNSPKDVWRPFRVSAPAPAGALRVEALFLYLQPGCETGSVFVDDVSFDASTPTSTSNVVANPSFSSGLTGWNPFGNVFTDARSFATRTPTGSAKLFSTFVDGANSGIYQSFPATAGTNWQADLYTLTTCQESPINGTNDNFGMARIVFRNSLDVEIGFGETVVLDHTSALGTWTPHTVTALAPPGTVAAQIYVLFISPTLQGGAMWVDDVTMRQVPVTGVPGSGSPLAFRLAQNTPNPFASSTRVEFALGREADVDIRVLDVSGRSVAVLASGHLAAGTHRADWNGRRSDGTLAPAGVYQCVMKTDAGQTSRRMVLTR